MQYGVFLLLYSSLWVAFGIVMHRSGVAWPKAVDPVDLLLLSLATCRLTEIVTEEKVARCLRAPFCEVRKVRQEDGTEIEEEVPRGRGVQRVAGELLLCPWCTSVWIATLLTFAYLLVPTVARVVLLAFAVAAGGVLFQILVKLLDRTRQSIPGRQPAR
jgi:Flp pilus assembly protein TadB